MRNHQLLILSVFFMCDLSFAGVCKIHYNRTACTGKEGESYSKCGGTKECDQLKKAATVNECQKLAMEACANSRFDITKSKIITADFDGKPIKATDGNSDFCISYPNGKTEFNQCK